MVIKSGKVVQLAYSLKDSEGDVLDQADARDPFVYLHGSQQIVPGLENALEGLKIGDRKKVTVSPDEGYGQVNPDLKLVVNRSQFPTGARIEAGMQFETMTPDGHGVVFTVESVDGDRVRIDGNHPLAGETLHFDVEVLGVRDATQNEIEHGHAHGPGGAHGHEHEHENEHESDEEASGASGGEEASGASRDDEAIGGGQKVH